MQLRKARLCLDCEEIHDAEYCPICASEAFAYLSRWVEAPERRARPRTATSPHSELYRPIVNPPAKRSFFGKRLLKRGIWGVAAVGLAGWMFKSTKSKSKGSGEEAA